MVTLKAKPNLWLIAVFFLLLINRIDALDVTQTSDWPAWWWNAVDPGVRNQGSLYLQSKETSAVGHVMLARHYEGIGQIPKALYHAKEAANSESASDATRLLSLYLESKNFGRLGRTDEQKPSIQAYRKLFANEVASQLQLPDPQMLEFYRVNSMGKNAEAHAILKEIGDPKDTDQFLEVGFAKANLVSNESRDASLPYKEIENLFSMLQRGKSPNNFRLFSAGALYSERLFQIDEAIELCKESMKSRSDSDFVLPETDLARLNIMLCHWSEAAEWLEKAQNAKMTLRPNYRQEAIKDLALALADFYLATGHPDRALTSLEGIEEDFFRPGYSTESIEYYLAGFYLRKFLATDLQIKLVKASWWSADLKEKLAALPGILSLEKKRLGAKMRFSENIQSRLLHAPYGVDIALLYYGPSWLLPAMEAAVGKNVFQKIAKSRAPEGKRAKILNPILEESPDSKTRSVEGMPPLLRAIYLSRIENPAALQEGYDVSSTAFLLSGHLLPISVSSLKPNPRGWMEYNSSGFTLTKSESTNTITLSTKEGKVLRSDNFSSDLNRAAFSEKLNKSFLQASFDLSERLIKKIEGGAVDFQTTSASKKK